MLSAVEVIAIDFSDSILGKRQGACRDDGHICTNMIMYWMMQS